MNLATATLSKGQGEFLCVSNCSDLRSLVKESELITGLPGRKFYVRSADRIAYRLHCQASGYTVQRLDTAGYPTCTMFMTFDMFFEHGLGAALRNGQLFTKRLLM